MSNILVKIHKYIWSINLYKLYVMVTNIVLSNLLVSLAYELLRKYFYVMKYNICILLLKCWHVTYIYFN
jgi:hypothetical protein